VHAISFDDMKALMLFEKDIDSFIDLHVRGNSVIFIDEVHYSKECGKKLKYIFDKEKTKIIISGSSAPELSIQSARFLVGRMLTFTLYPFSFKEYIRSQDAKLSLVYARGKYGQEVLELLNQHLDQFILYGGYPRVALAKTPQEKEIILRNIYSTFLLREIKELFSLSDNDKLMILMKSLSLQTGNLINYNELSQLTGFSYTDLKKYLRILEETYILKRVLAFHTNKRTELAKTPKVYFIDLGFRNSCIDNFSKERSDLGAMHENAVYAELTKQGKNMKYWRTKSGAEVDFVIEGKTILPIEVKTTTNDTTLGRSYMSFLEKYSPKKAILASRTYETKKQKGKTTVYFMPFATLFKK